MAITYTQDGLAAIIADDIARGDLTTQIGEAIETAVNTLKFRKFWFNQTKNESFNTVADQSDYTSADDAAIPLMLEIKGMIVEDSDGIRFDLGEPIDPVAMELLQGNGSATGRPVEWSYLNETFSFYPIPDAVYTIIPMGSIIVALPLTGSTAGNVWMTHGFETVRSEAKAYLYAHVIKDDAEASKYVELSQSGQATLDHATSLRTATGRITPTSW